MFVVVLRTEGFMQYMQVAQSLQNPETLARELNACNKIAYHHEKMIITMDDENCSYNGVEQINIIDWLLGK